MNERETLKKKESRKKEVSLLFFNYSISVSQLNLFSMD